MVNQWFNGSSLSHLARYSEIIIQFSKMDAVHILLSRALLKKNNPDLLNYFTLFSQLS